MALVRSFIVKEGFYDENVWAPPESKLKSARPWAARKNVFALCVSTALLRIRHLSKNSFAFVRTALFMVMYTNPAAECWTPQRNSPMVPEMGELSMGR
ncbi:hypothetical protein L596_019200 [Steinernema carpocapsae]|uniref:Uncharacterized protein n=1 Tax=Steinernema carpocapsae TaxID=34508 RepID=A0A4U5MPR1_STECR|nr:hypothetical protein L596_019200 [Steinernema carpocapsae]